MANLPMTFVANLPKLWRTFLYSWKNQHGGDWEQSRPQGPKNVHNFLLTVRPLSWACGHVTKCYWFLKNYLTWLLPDIFRYDSPKKSPTILYAVFVPFCSGATAPAVKIPVHNYC